MRKGLTVFVAAFMVAALVTITAGAAVAQGGNICVYANDHVSYMQSNPENTVDGYLVTATSQTYITPVQTGGESNGFSAAQDIVLNPTKKILYVADAITGDVAAMKIDPGTCELSHLGNYIVGKMSRDGTGLAVSPNGKWLYVTGISSATLKLLNIRSDGSLSGAKQTIALPARPSDMIVTPDGTTLVVGSPQERTGTNEALSYSISPSTGMLALVSTALTHGQPGGLSVDSQSKFVYVAEGSNNLRVGQLEVGTGSALTFVRAYTFTNVTASQTGSTLVSTNGEYLYVTNPNEATVVTLAANSVTGGLKYVTSSSDGTPPDDQPIGLATARNGKFVFTGEINARTDSEANLGILAAGQDGSLTSLGTFPLGQGTDTTGFVEWIVAVSF